MTSSLIGCYAVLELYSTEIFLLASAIIACIGLVISSNSYREHNRPYITFNIEPGPDPKHIVIAIRNTGNRGANDVYITITPPLKSILYHSEGKNDPISELHIPFISPGQEMVSHFEYEGHIATSDHIESYKVKTLYKYRKYRKFNDSYIIDLSYLRKFYFKPKPEEWGVD